MSNVVELPTIRRFLVWLALSEDAGVASIARGVDAEHAAAEYMEEWDQSYDARELGYPFLVCTVDQKTMAPELVEVSMDTDPSLMFWGKRAGREAREAFAVVWAFSQFGIFGQMARPRDERPQRKAG
jgi:hypothetical protein